MMLVGVILSCSCVAGLAAEPEFSPEQIEFFEREVRPLLVQHCFECHSEDAKNLKGGLRLDGRALAIAGGDSGPAIVPENPDDSLLIEAVRWQSYEMPPKGKLSQQQIATLVEWISIGAPWPDDSATVDSGHGYDWQKWRREHWAFQPVSAPQPPVVRDDDGWIQNSIDNFVLARLEAHGLSPAQAAAPETLVRRIFFDLIGLPPTTQQVEQILTAERHDRPAAIEALVDELLASPHYGERWGRYWLDVARYSDGYGGFLDNAALPQAWRYRDWVVEAFNDDLPFNEFLRLQIAGDLIVGQQGAVATGFFALGPTYRSDGGDPDSVAQAQAETLADRMDTLGRGMLGLTVACAQCHDHKFDPIPQQDYYSLAGVFQNTSIQESPLVAPEVVRAYNDHHQAIKQLENKIKEQTKRQLNDDEQQQLDAWRQELDRLKQTAPAKYEFAHGLVDRGSDDMKVAIRGNLRKPGETAPRRFLKIIAGEQPQPFTEGSGRLQLAAAVADPQNPLTARVCVNRVWMHHFGEALVRSPSNFGHLGQRPTHPELLDWLTAQFVDSGWSFKQLHRIIMQSAAYQMSSRTHREHFEVDGGNRFVWRMNPRRMDVESLRDAMMAVTGELDRTLGGPPTDKIDSRRRTLYFQVSRNGDRFASDELLRLFDFPLMRATVAKRPTSIVPQQFLFLMNSPFMEARAKALDERLHREAQTEEQRITLAYRLLYSRAPSAEEAALGLEYLNHLRGSVTAELTNWQQYAQVLLSANEFMFLR